MNSPLYMLCSQETNNVIFGNFNYNMFYFIDSVCNYGSKYVLVSSQRHLEGMYNPLLERIIGTVFASNNYQAPMNG